ncbi:MAG: S26 family signal peptidase [Treponema sp.]|jgi:signal peptidase I|nr:S26 family signal peptidase [Treponema sp.]
MTEKRKTVFFDRVQAVTEAFLTYRKRRNRLKKEKRAKKSQVRDWIDAFIWAACMVLLANQYLVQAYRIPSGSMIDTLNIGDHVFVNKLVYGPELLPGVLKLPSPVKPERNEIIIFENPTYISKGPVFDIAQRVIYMLTLSLIDIDRDEAGNQRVHFLIKRAAASAGDHIVMDKGNMKIKFSGEDRWVTENEYNAQRNWNHNIIREVSPSDYSVIEAVGYAMAWNMDFRMPVPQKILEETNKAANMHSFDYLAREEARLEMLRMLAPQDGRYKAEFSKIKLGRYIPEGRVLPLGDNRDNSRDGREFGPVKTSKVLGKGMIVYWPITKIRGMK